MGLRFPQTIWVVPTTRCNTRCRTCGHFYHDFGEDMTPEVFAKIDNEVLDHVRRVHLVGGGEPLVSKIFPAMLEACIRRKIKIFFITNTIALTEELVHVLVQNNAEIMISLDGATAPTYNSIRPLIRFENVLAKLEMIKSVRAKYPKNSFKLLTNTVVMKRNLHELPDIVKLAKKMRVDTIQFSDLIPHDLDPDFLVEIPVNYPEMIREFVPPAIAQAKKYKMNFEMPSHYADFIPEQPRPRSRKCQDGEPGQLVYAEKSFIYPKRCELPWTHANFRVNGTITSCCIEGHSLGNLNESSFDEIWNGERYRAMRRLIHTNNPPNVCRRCNLMLGISAGNPSFYAKFREANHLRTLAFGDPELARAEGSGDGNGSLTVDGRAEFDLAPGEATFAALRLQAPTGAIGRAVIGDAAQDFEYDDHSILLTLPEAREKGRVTVRLESSGPVTVTGVDLLSYEHKAVNLNLTANKPVLDKFHGQLALMGERLDEAMRAKPGIKTAVVFGANAVGAWLRDMAESKGLLVLGYADNYIGFFDYAEAYRPKDMAELKPDVVLIASKAHAREMAAQAKRYVDKTTTIITGRP